MSKHYEHHVQSVVKGFLELLEPEAREAISQAHIDELEMLMESAISTAVLQQLEAVADEVSGMAELIRRRAERYEPPGAAG
jgi:hypothetical protein